jgi:hypothetical protein
MSNSDGSDPGRRPTVARTAAVLTATGGGLRLTMTAARLQLGNRLQAKFQEPEALEQGPGTGAPARPAVCDAVCG